MTETVLEIAICKLKPGKANTGARDKGATPRPTVSRLNKANTGARDKAMQAVRNYPGFVGWKAMEGVEDPLLIVDVVEWQSLAHASAAGKNVMTDPEFADYMGAIGEVVMMQHFKIKSAI